MSATAAPTAPTTEKPQHASTCPKTPEGRRQSRRNSTKHGLSGAGTVLPPDVEAEVAALQAGFAACFQPQDDHERTLIRQMALGSVRTDRCFQFECKLTVINQLRDVENWDADRASLADHLAARLEKDPTRAVLQMLRFVAGCEWILSQWHALAAGLEGDRCAWTDADLTRALDLSRIGLDIRHIDPRADRLRTLRAQASSEIPDPAALSELRELVSAEIAAADERADACFRAESLEFDALREGKRFDMSPGVNKLRRLFADAQRLYDRAYRALTLHRAGKTTPKPTSTARPAPAPKTPSFSEQLHTQRDRAEREKPVPPPTPPPAPQPKSSPSRSSSFGLDLTPLTPAEERMFAAADDWLRSAPLKDICLLKNKDELLAPKKRR